MPRVLQFVLAAASALLGLVLAAIIVAVWQPCVDVPMPLTVGDSSGCAAVSSGSNTSWIGLLLWPAAAAAAGVAAVRAILRWGGVAAWAIAILFVALVFLANPLPEYWLLNSVAQSWDEPPYTGSLTAATLVLAGGVMLLTTEPRTQSAKR